MDGDKELIEKIGRILNGCSCSICILNADKAIALVREHDGRLWKELRTQAQAALSVIEVGIETGMFELAGSLSQIPDRLVAALDAIPQSTEPPASAESRVKELEHRIEGLIDKYEGCPHTVDCGCAQDKPSDICAHHAPQLRKALAENAALKREVSMWRSEHDPCPFSLENETLRAEVERLDKQIARFLEPVSDEERRVANHRAGIRCWTKDEVESLIANWLEPKGRPINPPQEPK